MIFYEQRKTYRVWLFALAVLTGAVGIAIGWYAGTRHVGDSRPAAGVGGGPGVVETAAGGKMGSTLFSLNFSLLMQDHVTRTARLMTDIYDGLNTEGDRVNLDENTVRLADTVGDYYGSEARTIFLQSWRDHISYFEDYVASVKDKDAGSESQARANLLEFTASMGQIFSRMNPHLTAVAVERGLNIHTSQMLRIVDMHAEGNNAAEKIAIEQAKTHAKDIADLISNGIVEQYPERF